MKINSNEQYDKDLAFIEKIDSFTADKTVFLAYFFPLFGCLMAHMLYFTLFLSAGVKEMAIFNVFSMTFYLFEMIFFKKVKDKINLIYASIAEIILHVCFATVFVGWTPDFGMFLLMLVTMVFLMPNRNSKIPFIIMFSCIVPYCILHFLYIDEDSTVYQINETVYATIFYVINFVIGGFVLIYTSVIYTFRNRYLECKLRVQNEQLKVMASIDPLTKLSNRRAMKKDLDEVSGKSKEGGKKYVVGIGDIDNFKKVNDTYGHDYGDIVLTTVASVIRDTIPENGHAARWGGEEFFFVLADSDIEEGRAVADSMISQIRQKQFTKDGVSFSVTMTFGICEGLPDDDVDAVITRADKRLYVGKNNGKNHTEYTDRI